MGRTVQKKIYLPQRENDFICIVLKLLQKIKEV